MNQIFRSAIGFAASLIVATITIAGTPHRGQNAPKVPSQSMVRQAAHVETMDEMPPRLVRRSAVIQASGDCVGEPSCGFEVGCGAESCSVVGCDGCEPSCGSESFVDGSLGFETCGAGGCDACGMTSGSDSCSGNGTIDTYNFCLPILRIDWKRFEFFAGTASFTGPANYANVAPASTANPSPARAGATSFGFYEGLNEGRSLKRLLGIDLAAQLGVRATQSSLSGTEFSMSRRNQIFVTGGLFRRVDYGLQYGVVFDYLNDDWYYRSDLTQLRGELSWNTGKNLEIGYQFASAMSSSTSRTEVFDASGVAFSDTVTFRGVNQHRVFLRGSLGGGGMCTLFAGGTDQSDGLLGAIASSPVRRGFAFQAGTTYLIPNESRLQGGNEHESWNLSMGIMFRPGGRQVCGRYCRPLFDVADNGSFLVDRR